MAAAAYQQCNGGASVAVRPQWIFHVGKVHGPNSTLVSFNTMVSLSWYASTRGLCQNYCAQCIYMYNVPVGWYNSTQWWVLSRISIGMHQNYPDSAFIFDAPKTDALEFKTPVCTLMLQNADIIWWFLKIKMISITNQNKSWQDQRTTVPKVFFGATTVPKIDIILVLIAFTRMPSWGWWTFCEMWETIILPLNQSET